MLMSREATAYRQTEVQTASPVEVVIMLYDTLVRDLNQVIAAVRVQDVEERVRQSNHVFSVLQQLDLMLDHENGGDTAKELARVYSYVRARVIESQIKLDTAILERQIEFILQVREAWQSSVNASQMSVVPASGDGRSYSDATGKDSQSCSWSA
jgi:flagellar protein FliS